jgi:Arc/MetJ family transcription regulator
LICLICMLKSGIIISMRTTIEIPDDLLADAMAVSGARTKRAAIRWALEEALRSRAVKDLLSRKVKIEFDTTPDELEAREIEDRHETGRRRGHR